MESQMAYGMRHRGLRFVALLVAFCLLAGLAAPLWASAPAKPAAEAASAQIEKGDPAPKLKTADYPRLGNLSSRIFVWLVAQLHLFFAAFVLAVPIFVLVIEGIGMATGDPRYDRMAHEFIKISLTAYSFTAIFGGVLAFALLVFYPHFIKYLASIFGPMMIVYALLFFGESACLYVYYYGWDAMREGFLKWVHLTIGLLLNAVGTVLLVLANSWATFMMAPSGVDSAGAFLGNVWAAVHGPLWNPLNLHRFIANVAFGGSIVGAYAAYRFLAARDDADRAHYDWMGYTANFIAVSALLPLPFAGYWLTAEVYAYSQQMGITLMGGVFAWLFIIQAVLIGALFLAANYYLWCGMERSPGAERYTRYVKYLAFVIVACFLVWFTPHSLIMTNAEIKAMGGTHHSVLGPLGLMPAKNAAVNLMILTTFLSFLFYRRCGKTPVVPWIRWGRMAQSAVLITASVNIVLLGIYGYLVPANVKVGQSVPQVVSTLMAILIVMAIEVFMYRKAQSLGPVRWGRMSARSQYALFLLAVTFTWLMGLMGYVRSSIRQHWHVYTVFRDNSPDAYTPTLGYAANVVSLSVVIFMACVIFIFWLNRLSAKGREEAVEDRAPASATAK